MLTASREWWALEANPRACTLPCYGHDRPICRSFKDMADPTDERCGVALSYDTVTLSRPDVTLGYLDHAVGRMLPGSDPDELAGLWAFDHILPGNLGGGVRGTRAAVSCRRFPPPRHLLKEVSWIHLKKVAW